LESLSLFTANRNREQGHVCNLAPGQGNLTLPHAIHHLMPIRSQRPGASDNRGLNLQHSVSR